MDTHLSAEERVRRLEALDAEINGRGRRPLVWIFVKGELQCIIDS